MILTPSDLLLVRTRPQRTQLALSIYQPETLFEVIINPTGTLSKGSMIIPYGTVITGSYANVLPDSTLLVGSTLGAQDLGKVRIKSADASNLYVAENSEIIWPSGSAITSALLHFNGVSGSTSFPDDSGKTWIPAGNAKISTAQSKFGGSSAYFDGTTGTQISTPQNSDFDFGNEDFTIDGYVFLVTGTPPTSGTIYEKATSWTLYAPIRIQQAGGSATLKLYLSSNGSAWDLANGTSIGTPSLNSWTHIAVVRHQNTVYTFKGGSVVSTITLPGLNPSLYLNNSPTYIGGLNGIGFYGYLQEFRVTKGLALWTAPFTPPAAPSTYVPNQTVYVTALNYVDLWPKYPVLTTDSSGNNVIFYKDTNVLFANQNNVLGTFVCMGPHRAAYRDPASGLAQLYYSSSGSYNVKGDALTWVWQFEGGSPSYYSGTNPGYVSYATPGHYRVTATATNASGGSDTGYRFVSIYDRPKAGSHTPIEHWELLSLNGTRDAGGYTAKIRVYDDLTSIQDGALVVLFADEMYGYTQKSLGGNSLNNEFIKLVGYIQKDTITYDYKEKWAEFEIGSITALMKQTTNFAVSCYSVKNATTWFELPYMTPHIALYHYLYWHSTLCEIADIAYTGQDTQFQYFDTTKDTMYSVLQKFMANSLVGEVVSDRQGKVWFEIAARAIPNAPTAIPIAMQIQKSDWMGQPSIDEIPLPVDSYLEYGGIAYFGPTNNDFSAYMACAPGSSPSYRGKTETLEGLILTDQITLNALVGNVFAYVNSRWLPTLSMSENLSNLDIAPIEQAQLNILAGDTIRGVIFTNAPFHVTEMDWTYKGEDGSFLPKIKFAQVTIGNPGDTIPVPPNPPAAGFTVPPFTLPVIPAWSFPGYSIGTPGCPDTVVLLDAYNGIWYTDNFTADNPQWWSLNGGAEPAGIDQIKLSTSRTLYAMNKINGIYAGQLGPAGLSNSVLNYAWGLSQYPGYDIIYSAIGLLNKSDVLAFIMGRHDTIGAISNFWYGGLGGVAKKATAYYNHGGIATLFWGGGKWLYPYQSGLGGTTLYLDRYNADGSALEADHSHGNEPASGVIPACRAGVSSLLLIAQTGPDSLYFTPDNGDTLTLKSAAGAFAALACDPSGYYLMATIGGATNPVRSSDGGTTWGSIPIISGSYGATAFANVGNPNGWIVANSKIMFSPDFGDTWYDKTGNLLSFLPSPTIAQIEYL